MSQFLKWQSQDRSSGQRILALAAGALIFPAAIPLFLAVVSPKIDRYFGIQPLDWGWIARLIGAAAILSGGVFAVWTIVVQFTLASGTPFPMLPTRKLLTVGPFKHCRNPMTLGTLMVYGGIAVWSASVTALAAVAVFAIVLIGYLVTVEEKELRERFGDEYGAYRRKTPFIIPIRRPGH
ncbi:MAG: isoprenylcysteine carboxylmethyltransferase family protein [bacterium]|nr:isoprenylcysteine carboxylmethyltransferase family protein [bacterium]